MVVSTERSRLARSARSAIRSASAMFTAGPPGGAGTSLTMRPSSRRTTRVAKLATSSSCVISTIVRPASLSSTSRRMTSSVDTLSSAPVGSSARIIAGLVTSARAIATRCCWPPESSLGMCPARAASPTCASAARARARAVALAAVHQRQLDVALRAGAGEQVERLEHEADLAVADRRELVVGQVDDVLAVEPVAAAGRVVQAAEDVHHRRLARPRVPHDRDHLALVDGQRDVIEGAHLDGAGAVDLRDAVEFEHGHRGGKVPPRPGDAAERSLSGSDLDVAATVQWNGPVAEPQADAYRTSCGPPIPTTRAARGSPTSPGGCARSAGPTSGSTSWTTPACTPGRSATSTGSGRPWPSTSASGSTTGPRRRWAAARCRAPSGSRARR